MLQSPHMKSCDTKGSHHLTGLLLHCAHYVCQADELEWGAPGAEERVQRLASMKPDLVLAADCCYIDQDGESPSTPHFIQACKGQLQRQSTHAAGLALIASLL